MPAHERKRIPKPQPVRDAVISEVRSITDAMNIILKEFPKSIPDAKNIYLVKAESHWSLKISYRVGNEERVSLWWIDKEGVPELRDSGQ